LQLVWRPRRRCGLMDVPRRGAGTAAPPVRAILLAAVILIFFPYITILRHINVSFSIFSSSAAVPLYSFLISYYNYKILLSNSVHFLLLVFSLLNRGELCNETLQCSLCSSPCFALVTAVGSRIWRPPLQAVFTGHRTGTCAVGAVSCGRALCRAGPSRFTTKLACVSETKRMGMESWRFVAESPLFHACRTIHCCSIESRLSTVHLDHSRVCRGRSSTIHQRTDWIILSLSFERNPDWNFSSLLARHVY
jgi:hypothetical protein